MPNAPMTAVLRHLCRVAAKPADNPCPDSLLLERFGLTRDEAAFAELVARHGPMVLGVCRSVLRHEQEAEDAFQATFLILAQKVHSIRQRESLASWLYGVAYRLALRARARASRRRAQERTATDLRTEDPVLEMSLRELRQVVHEELERLPEKYRAPLVLCYLEGKTYEAAARQLGWTKYCVRGRLERGRASLRSRLAGRGLVLSTGLVALLLAPAAVRAGLTASTTRAAVLGATGRVSAEVAALVRAAGPTLVAAKLRTLTVVTLAAGLLAVAGVLGHQALAEPQVYSPPKEAARPAGPTIPPAAGPKAAPAGGRRETIAVVGRVLGPDGKPFAGARLYVAYDADEPREVRLRATSGGDGRFHFTFPRGEVTHPSWKEDAWRLAQLVAVAPGYGPAWTDLQTLDKGDLTLRLVRDEVSVSGRLLDLQGRPVAGATVRVRLIQTTAEEDLAARIEAGKYHPYLSRLWISRQTNPALPGTLTADADGRFRLTGVGRERVVIFDVEGPGIENVEAWVVTRPALATRTINVDGRTRAVYPASFDLAVGPTRPIIGTVRQKATGKPLAGAVVYGNDRTHWHGARAVTDAQGHYRLVGLPKLAWYDLRVYPKQGEVFLPAGREIGDSEGLQPLRADFELAPGVAVRVRLVDRDSRRLVRGTLEYAPLPENAFLTEPAGQAFRRAGTCSATPGPDGTLRLVLPPGPGVLFATVWSPGNPYLPARPDPADRAKSPGNDPDQFLGRRLSWFNAYRLIQPRAGETLDVEVPLVRGRTVRVAVLDPDGKPLAGAKVRGLMFHALDQRVLDEATFEAAGLDPARPRRLVFLHPGRKLAAQVQLRGDEPQPFAVRLEPWGTLAGQVTDEEGHPLVAADVRLYYRLGPGDDSQEAIRPTRDSVETDRDGRYSVEGLIPGMEYDLVIVKHHGKGFYNQSYHAITPLVAGETRDLGSARVIKYDR